MNQQSAKNQTKNNTDNKKQSKIHQEEIKEDPKEDDIEQSIDGEQSDDQINEELFTMYDKLFQNYNDFGSMFQSTAHHIGLLIRKNMLLNQQLEDVKDELELSKKKQQETEESYENLLLIMGEKDKFSDEIMNENAGLRLQLEQFLPKHTIPQRDILKEREEAIASAQSSKQRQIDIDKFDKNRKNLPKLDKPNSDNKNKNQLIAGTFETFFEIGKPATSNNGQFDESCSLKDLFSLKNSKKRGVADLEEEDKKAQWITNKRKVKRQFVEDSQVADKFDQLSQAFFHLNSGGMNHSNPVRDSNRQSLSGSGSVQIIGEDSSSSTSVINAGIRFDAQQAKESLKQSKLNFNNGAKDKKQQKKFEIQVVEQVSESQLDDFFSVKNDKKTNRNSNNSHLFTSAGSNRNNNKGSSAKSRSKYQ